MYLKNYMLGIAIIFSSILNADWTSTPTTIDTGNASTGAPLIVDSEGNVTSAWLENFNDIGDDPQAAYFSSSLQQWMPAQMIYKAGAGLSAPQLIVDDFGTVTMIWLEFYSESANSATLFASRSIKGGPWTIPTPLNSLVGGIPTNAQVPVALVVDMQGNVTVAWLEQNLNNNNYAIGTARFTSDIDASPTLYPFLDGPSANANSTIHPQLSIDELGYVTAIWQEQTNMGYAIQASRLDPLGAAWSSVANLNNATLNANGNMAPRMVIDSLGVVTVIWEEIGMGFILQAARFTPGLGGSGGSWITYNSVCPALDNANGTITPQVIVDAQGSATLVAVDVSLSVWPSTFSIDSSSWISPASPLNEGIAFSLTPLSLVVDATGIVTILWLNNDSAQLIVQAARGAGDSWSAAVDLNSGNTDGNSPLLLGIDSNANVTACWTETTTINASRHTIQESTWSNPTTLNNGNLYNLIPPKMLVSTGGLVTVVWQEGPTLDNKYSIEAANFSPNSNMWSSSTILDNGTQTPDAFYSSMTQQINMVMDNFNKVTVTWLENINDLIAVQAARFSSGPLPPSSIHGKQIQNQFLSQTDLVNIIEWQAPDTGPAPTSYNIYRDNLSTLIGTVPASQPLIYADHNRAPNTIYTYYVASLDAGGNPSLPAEITIVP